MSLLNYLNACGRLVFLVLDAQMQKNVVQRNLSEPQKLIVTAEKEELLPYVIHILLNFEPFDMSIWYGILNYLEYFTVQGQILLKIQFNPI